MKINGYTERYMHGIKRRITYVALFELFGILFTTYGLILISGREAGQSSLVATIISVLAIVWNFTYNTGFEYLESWLNRKGRSFVCRLVHAVGFELGLAITTVPLLAFALGISLWAALLANVGIMLFFMGYAFCFNLVFDSVFGLPLSAQGRQS